MPCLPKFKAFFKVFNCKGKSTCESNCFNCHTIYGDNRLESKVNGVSVVDIDLNEEDMKVLKEAEGLVNNIEEVDIEDVELDLPDKSVKDDNKL